MSRRVRVPGIAAVSLAGFMLVAASSGAPANHGETHWVRSWGTAVMAPEDADDYPDLPRTFADQTLRQRVSLSLGGRHLRVSISNEFGTRALEIGAAHVARSAGGAAVEAESDRVLTFGGRTSVTVPIGAVTMSDGVDLDVAKETILAVSLYLPKSTAGSPNTVHQQGFQEGYLSKRGNFVDSASPPTEAPLHAYYYLSAIDVEAPRSTSAIVALGDSITDGYGATPSAQRDWPSQLVRRLPAIDGRSVINVGIGGNRLLHRWVGPSARERIDRDVFAIPGVRYLIVLEGTNDIAGAQSLDRPEEDVTVEDLTTALHEIASSAQERDIRVIVGTILPTGGSSENGYSSDAGESKRQAVNAWIRRNRDLDGVVDFDRAIRDPARPSSMKPEYDSGDHLHPNDAGYAAMAAAVSLDLLGLTTTPDSPKKVHW